MSNSVGQPPTAERARAADEARAWRSPLPLAPVKPEGWRGVPGDAMMAVDLFADAPTVTQRHIVFSHGQESAPWGRKISVLAETARALGYEAHSVDYRGIAEPGKRVSKLIQFCQTLQGEVVLAGSSVGGYVSVCAAQVVSPRGVFVIAPALYLPQLPPLPEGLLGCPVSVVHGFGDEIVPYEDSVRFAKQQGAALHLLQGDHLLHEQLTMISQLFERFLMGLAPSVAAIAPAPDSPDQK